MQAECLNIYGRSQILLSASQPNALKEYEKIAWLYFYFST